MLIWPETIGLTAGFIICITLHQEPQRLREAVERVLNDPSYRQNAQRVATCLRRYGGPTHAAELLERIVPR